MTLRKQYNQYVKEWMKENPPFSGPYNSECLSFKQFKENMIGGAQPKVLLKLNDGNELLIDEAFASIYGKEEDHKYKLVRERDQLTKTSRDVKWLVFDENGKYKEDFENIAVGRSLLMSPFGPSFTWQTTPVTEIVEQREDYIKFNTENSVYELFVLSK
jgi:hypothetical protein